MPKQWKQPGNLTTTQHVCIKRQRHIHVYYKPSEADIQRIMPLFLCQIVLHSNTVVKPQVSAYPAKGQCAEDAKEVLYQGKSRDTCKA